MYKTISLFDFRQTFSVYGRRDNFSDSGLDALFNHFEQIEVDTGEQTELDVIAICCEFSEYNSALEAMGDYTNIDEYADIDEDDALEWLNDRTFVLECDNGHIVIQNF